MKKYTLTETTRKNGKISFFTLYKGDSEVKESANIEVIKRILKRQFNKVYETRAILYV